MNIRHPALTVAMLVLAAASSAAHHSRAEFDMTREVTLVGTVKRVAWTNPHTYIYVEAADEKGQPTEWAVEFGAVGQLMRAGWSAHAVKPGDKIKVVGSPARDPAGRTFFQRSVFGYTATGEEVRLPVGSSQPGGR